jgi:hypothetical protein
VYEGDADYGEFDGFKSNFSGDSPSLREAQNSNEWPHWEKAINIALEKLKKFKTAGPLEQVPKNGKMVSYRWVLKKKREYGKVVGYKARIAIRGFTQRPGIDYNATYAPVVNQETLRTILVIAAQESMYLFQADGTSAFSQGDMEEDLWIPELGAHEGVIGASRTGHKMLKAMEGTKQGAHQWYKKFSDVMINQLGFQRLPIDNCVFQRGAGPDKLIVPLHVDDMPIAAGSVQAKDKFLQEANKFLVIADKGPIDFFLGTAVAYDRHAGTLSLSQEDYVVELLEKYGMTDCRPVALPTATGEQESNKDKTSNFPIRELVGGLQWLASGTRPDIAFAVNVVAQEQAKGLQSTVNKAKHILRYLKGTQGYKLKYKKQEGSGVTMTCYQDADYANDHDRRSISGYTIFVNGNLVAWKIQKQQTVAKSTTEAEYVAMSLATSSVIYLREVLKELGYPQGPTVMFEDNAGALGLAKNRITNGRAKHIDVHHHFIRERIENGDIKPQYIMTKEQVADIMTKGLRDVKLHQYFTSKMGVGI